MPGKVYAYGCEHIILSTGVEVFKRIYSCKSVSAPVVIFTITKLHNS